MSATLAARRRKLVLKLAEVLADSASFVNALEVRAALSGLGYDVSPLSGHRSGDRPEMRRGLAGSGLAMTTVGDKGKQAGDQIGVDEAAHGASQSRVRESRG